MPTLLFYEKPAPLNRERHAGLKLRTDGDFGFASMINSVMLVGEEFAEAQRHFPIVFVQIAPRQFFPAVLLGVRGQENLFVDAAGEWAEGVYIPAFVRRYPFVLAPDGAVCIDEAGAALSTAEGEPLFLEDGKNSPMLDRISAFLAKYQAEVKKTQSLCDELRDRDLLKAWTVQVVSEAGEAYRMDGLYIVDTEKLNALPDETIAAWFRTGQLACLQAQAASMQNLNRLVRRAAPAPAAAPQPAPERVH